MIVYAAIGLVFLVVVLILFSCGPRQGTMMFGICRTFLELNVPYPETLQHNIVEQGESAVRINYTQTNPFGEYTLEMIECSFRKDPQRGLLLRAVQVNRQAVEASRIDSFNHSIPAIVASHPDLDLPQRFPTNIKNLR